MGSVQAKGTPSKNTSKNKNKTHTLSFPPYPPFPPHPLLPPFSPFAWGRVMARITSLGRLRSSGQANCRARPSCFSARSTFASLAGFSFSGKPLGWRKTRKRRPSPSYGSKRHTRSPEWPCPGLKRKHWPVGRMFDERFPLARVPRQGIASWASRPGLVAGP